MAENNVSPFVTCTWEEWILLLLLLWRRQIRVASANGDKRRSCGVIPGEASSSSSSPPPTSTYTTRTAKVSVIWNATTRIVITQIDVASLSHSVQSVAGWRGERQCQCQCEWETTDTRCLINFMQISLGGRWIAGEMSSCTGQTIGNGRLQAPRDRQCT